MKTKRYSVLALLMIITMLFAGCAPAPAPAPVVVKETVVVEKQVPMTVVVKETVRVPVTVPAPVAAPAATQSSAITVTMTLDQMFAKIPDSARRAYAQCGKLDCTKRYLLLSAFTDENKFVLENINVTSVIPIVWGEATITYTIGIRNNKPVVALVSETSMINATAATIASFMLFNADLGLYTGISGGTWELGRIGDVFVPQYMISYQENYWCNQTPDGKNVCPPWFTPAYPAFGAMQIAPSSLPGGKSQYWFLVDPAILAAAEKVDAAKLESCTKGTCLAKPVSLYVGGRAGSAQTFLDNAPLRTYLDQTLKLKFIEMEGSAFLHACALMNKKCGVIRANSDLAGGGNPEDKLPDGSNPIGVFWGIAAKNAGLVTLGILDNYDPKVTTFSKSEPNPEPTPVPPPPPAPTKVVTPTVAPAAKPFTFGVVLVGPYNDHGWSEAHYAAGKYVEKMIPGAKMIYVDNLNPGAKPGVTVPQVVEDLVSKGAQLILTTSDDFKDGTLEAALKNPKVPIVNASGDHAWKAGKDFKAPANLANFMGRMEYGKMIAGCAAALTSTTGKIGYLGPLINDETRRLAASAYLGAKYCWTTYAKKDPAALKFKVTWIGFWFNIPGQTLDPTKVADDFYNSGYDVVLSGIDTTEALVEAGKMAKAGKPVWTVAYDYKDGCAEAPNVCLGVPYFNWGPAYVKAVKLVQDGKWASYFEWNGPDWANLNNPDTGAVGFTKGVGLTSANSATLDTFTKGLADGSIVLLKGPLNYQDGSVYLKAGEVATDQQVWYMGQLLQGMEGPSK